MSKTIKIGGRIESAEQGGVVTGANAILDDTKGKKQNVINSETDDELARLDNAKQDVLTFDNAPTEGSNNPVKSGGVYAADAALQQAIEAILQLIPSAATAMNQLADKAFVNSTEATNTATFRGTYNVVTDLSLHYNSTHQEIATALLSVVQTADNNDYCFVQIPVSDSSGDIRVTERYKFNGTAWSYEYDLNNSGFTADQWAAINSTITLALVQKLGALPTAAELAQQLALKQNTLTFDAAPVAGSSNPVTSGGLYNVIAAINATIPSGASVDNKLVAESRLTQYVAAIVNALDATFNVTSTDGHVNVRLTQVDGIITSVEVITNDIASASALNTLAGRVTTNEGDISAEVSRATQAEADLRALYNALQQSAPVIIQPTDTWPVASPSATVIYRVIDRVNTPPQYYSDYMFSASDLTPVLMATYNNAIDPRPKKGSQNLVTSGGVFDNMGALDVSELNATENPHTLATYADLSTALAAIPSDYQKGGMSIKFVQSSDNKYVQYRLMADTWSTTAGDWQGIDDEPTIGSNNLVKSGGVAKKLNKIYGDSIVTSGLKDSGTILFDTSIVSAGETLYYKCTNQGDGAISAACAISFYDSSDNRIGFMIRYDSTAVLKTFEGSKVVPEGFSYAKTEWGRLTVDYIKCLNIYTIDEKLVEEESINKEQTQIINRLFNGGICDDLIGKQLGDPAPTVIFDNSVVKPGEAISIRFNNTNYATYQADARISFFDSNNNRLSTYYLNGYGRLIEGTWNTRIPENFDHASAMNRLVLLEVKSLGLVGVELKQENTIRDNILFSGDSSVTLPANTGRTYTDIFTIDSFNGLEIPSKLYFKCGSISENHSDGIVLRADIYNSLGNRTFRYLYKEDIGSFVEFDIPSDTTAIYLAVATSNETNEEQTYSFNGIMLTYSASDKEYALNEDIVDVGSESDVYRSEIDDTSKKVNDLMTKPCLVYGILTDSHNKSDDRLFVNTIKNISAVNKKAYTDGTVHMGDILISSDPTLYPNWSKVNEELASAVGMIRETNKECFVLLGNHDGLNGNDVNEFMTYGSIEKFNEDYVVRDGINPWFYKDYSKIKTRVAFLAVPSKDNENNIGVYWGCGPNQLKWLADVVFNVENGWNVLLFAHAHPYEDWATQERTRFEELTSAFSNHTTYRNDGLNINVDYSSLTTSKIIALISGHTHADAIIEDNSEFEDYNLTFPIIAIGSCNMRVGGNPNTGYTNPARNKYSVTEDLWDTMVYRPDIGKIYMVRFGAGEDREINV